MSLDYTERWNTTEQTLPSNKRPLGGCRVGGCTWVLAHFYCRKPNWSARVCTPSFLSPRVGGASSLPSLPLFLSLTQESLFRESTGLPHNSWLSPCVYAMFWIQIAVFPFASSSADCQDRTIIIINEDAGGATSGTFFVLLPTRSIFLDAQLTMAETEIPRPTANARLFLPDIQTSVHIQRFTIFILASSGNVATACRWTRRERSTARRVPKFRRGMFYLGISLPLQRVALDFTESQM